MTARPANFNIDFMVPGMSKCGTTTFCSMLAQHPQVFIPAEKEPLLFINENYESSLEWYVNLFRDAPKDALLGEGSTFYSSITLEVGSRERILAFNPDIKLIFIMRDPIVRIESSFRELHNSGPFYGVYPPFDLGDALLSHPDILDDTRYWSRLNNFRDHMPPENILVIFLEDLQRNAPDVLARCYDFLGVDASFASRVTAQKLNSAEEKLRDTRLMRWVRKAPRLGRWISGLPLHRQDRIGLRLGLRTRRRLTPRWTEDTRRRVIQQLQPEMESFLTFMGKNTSIWPRYDAMLREFNTMTATQQTGHPS
jgi:hypothetical protein